MATLAFLLLGLVVGAFGTIVGAGGGFLLLPILLFAFPHESASVLAGISLSVVFVNAASGSLAYARLRRIDFRSGLVFALAGLPGAALGAALTARVDRHLFDSLLGAFLIVGAFALALRPEGFRRHVGGARERVLVERDGTVHRYAPRILLGALLSVVVGFVSTMLGIGGGILHVPAMVALLGFPIHVATATSHFVLAILALVGVLSHVADGSLRAGLARTLPLAAGAIVGAQAGARVSTRIQGRWILRALAVALALVGLRLLLTGGAR
jgi:uncharacterized membrane protein YfcA